MIGLYKAIYFLFLMSNSCGWFVVGWLLGGERSREGTGRWVEMEFLVLRRKLNKDPIQLRLGLFLFFPSFFFFFVLYFFFYFLLQHKGTEVHILKQGLMLQWKKQRKKCVTRSIVLVTAVATLYDLARVTKRDFDWNSFVLVTINSGSHKNNCNTEQYVTILRYSVSTDDYF